MSLKICSLKQFERCICKQILSYDNYINVSSLSCKSNLPYQEAAFRALSLKLLHRPRNVAGPTFGGGVACGCYCQQHKEKWHQVHDLRLKGKIKSDTPFVFVEKILSLDMTVSSLSILTTMIQLTPMAKTIRRLLIYVICLKQLFLCSIFDIGTRQFLSMYPPPTHTHTQNH